MGLAGSLALELPHAVGVAKKKKKVKWDNKGIILGHLEEKMS